MPTHSHNVIRSPNFFPNEQENNSADNRVMRRQKKKATKHGHEIEQPSNKQNREKLSIRDEYMIHQSNSSQPNIRQTIHKHNKAERDKDRNRQTQRQAERGTN